MKLKAVYHKLVNINDVAGYSIEYENGQRIGFIWEYSEHYGPFGSKTAEQDANIFVDAYNAFHYKSV